MFVGPEEPPPAEIVSDNQQPDQGEEDGDEGEVVGHAGQYQPQPAEPGGADIIGHDKEGQEEEIRDTGKNQKIKGC